MSAKKTPVILALLLTLMASLAFINKADDPISRLVTSLQRWTDSIPQEKVYLHMDKPYYALGDTIWFKGYVTIGSRHQLSALSGAVYVDLITDQDSLIRTLKLPVTAGMVMGNFILGDDLREGNYRLRSYTQWMRNAGEDYFFDHTFAVGNIAPENVVTKADYQYKTDGNKTRLTALLNYTDDEGRALGERDVRYQIFIKNKVVWAQNVKTDALGTLSIRINNDDNADLNGAYINTVISGKGKESITRNFPIRAGLAQTDVQFFPESGSLVNGIASRVGFKAVGVNGLGATVKGTITDDSGKEVARLESLHAGMGNFSLKPEKGKSYKAAITFADGAVKTVDLPKTTDDGYVLSVYQPGKDSLLIRIHASAALQQSTVNLIAHVSGESVFASPIKLNGPVTSVWLDKQSFPTGVAQFTLFNDNGDALNERLAFIRNNDQMQISLKSAKTQYKSKEAIKIDLNAKDSKGKSVAGNFSVTVIDENKVPVDEANESTIFTNLLLTSDLKGYVEQPNYYFTNVNDGVNRALDNLMLTQGYRRFTWKDLNNTTNTKPAFEVEGLGFKVSGRVETLSHKILPGADVMLMAMKAGLTKVTKADSLGRFLFDGIFLTDSIKFTVQARGPKNSDKVKIILDTIPRIRLSKNRNWADVNTNINATLKAYIDNGKKLDDIYEQTGQVDRVQRLKEVRIKAKRLKPDANINPQGMFRIANEQSADKVITFGENEAATCNTLAMCLQGRLPGINVETIAGYSSIKNMRAPYNTIGIILDGRKLNSADEISEVLDGSIDPADIAKILLVRTNQAMVSYLGGEYILIMMRVGTSRKQYNPSIANINPKGFNKVREFYEPKYNKPGADRVPDLRSTIYWNPYLKTGTDGFTTFNYFNADGPGNYKVIVEGINADGELARQVYRYQVEAGPVPFAAFKVPTVDKGLALITGPLDTFNRRMPPERVYVHTDRPYYNIGDTLWFKSYVTDHNLAGSKTSGVMYVELIDDSTNIARRVSVPVTDGLGWAQIPLSKNIFHEGAYTLRGFTNWMQNFKGETLFSQRFYLGIPAEKAWLVKSDATVNTVDGKDQLQLSLKLNKADKLLSPVAIRKVEVKIMELRTEEYDFQRWIYREKLQTGLDGSLNISQKLNNKLDGARLRMEITDLESKDGFRRVKAPIIINRELNIDLQFLPESGSLVAGQTSVVGVKALDEEGRGIDVSGVITDNSDNTVATFKTLYKGMGSFEFTPVAGQKYTAKLNQSKTKKYPLPKIKPNGTVMRIANTEQSKPFAVRITGLNTIDTDTACYLVAIVRGGIYYSKKIENNEPEFLVDKSIFPTGVVRFTLFKGKRPLNERKVFVDNGDKLAIKLKADKAQYQLRDSVGLELEVTDKNGLPVQGSFSLAVTDDSQVKADTSADNGIVANLLLKAELKGHVESPEYYLTHRDKNAWQALDNLMLTQGWTAYNYAWQDVFKPAKKIKYKAERPRTITGEITKLGGKPAINSPVILSSQKPALLLSTQTDSLGRYEFTGLPAIDTGSFFIQANNDKGKKMINADVAVDKFKEPPVPATASDPVLPWYVNIDTTQLNYMRRKAELNEEEDLKLTGRVLKEVKIKGNRIIPGSVLKGRSDLAFDETEIKQSAVTNLYELLKQKIPGFKIIRDWRYRRGAITTKIGDDYFIDRGDIMIDGRPFSFPVDDPTDLQEFLDGMSEVKITGLKTLEVVWSGKYLPQIKPYYFAQIHITTANKIGIPTFFMPGTNRYRPLPLMYPQQFYSPKYATKAPPKTADYRSTLFWEPNINTDRNGKAKVHFYTSDIKARYTVKIAGMDLSGGVGDGTFVINEPPKVN